MNFISPDAKINLQPQDYLDELRKKIEQLKGVSADANDIETRDLGSEQLDLWLQTKEIVEKVLELEVTDSQEKADVLRGEINELFPDNTLKTSEKDLQNSQGKFISFLRNLTSGATELLESWSLDEDRYEEVSEFQDYRRGLLEKAKKSCQIFLD